MKHPRHPDQSGPARQRYCWPPARRPETADRAAGGSPSGPVTYGVLSCFTGRLASLGQAMLQGAKVAQSEINSAGGVLGRKVQLVTGDTSCDVADGVTATNQMLTKNVSGVIGPETQEINGVEPILDANHIVDEFQGGDTARDHQTDPLLLPGQPVRLPAGRGHGAVRAQQGVQAGGHAVLLRPSSADVPEAGLADLHQARRHDPEDHHRDPGPDLVPQPGARRRSPPTRR